MNLSRWDTAGQDDFEAMRPISYTHADVFLLFFAIDNPTSFQNIKHKWYPEITKNHQDVPMLLVGTKCDTREASKVMEDLQKRNLEPISFEQGRKMARALGCLSYIECSAITRHGFKDIFNQTIMAILNLRKGKRPGGSCWDTSCPVHFTVFSKKSRCVRCHHLFCHDHVSTLPEGHEYAKETMCKKCKEIEETDPLTRPAGSRRRKLLGRSKNNGKKSKKEKDEKEEEEEEGEKEDEETTKEKENKDEQEGSSEKKGKKKKKGVKKSSK